MIIKGGDGVRSWVADRPGHVVSEVCGCRLPPELVGLSNLAD